MTEIENRFAKIGIQIPKIMLPGEGVDFRKWAVIACDQYTSERDYWKKVENCVESSPSTLKLIFPEVYLEDSDSEKRIEKIHTCMKEYVNKEILKEQQPGFILVQRNTHHSPTRTGLVVALDLEKYSYQKGAKSSIRATEGTIVERIPPRMKIRKQAPLELPHIMVLIDDPKKRVIEPLKEKVETLEKVYDFDLMMESGHITGYLIKEGHLIEQILNGLEELSDQKSFKDRYQVDDEILVFAMGDGNHSLAAAKASWEDYKMNHPDEPALMSHPARWALVELVNLYDEGIVFEPIHRVLFNVDPDKFQNELERVNSFKIRKIESLKELEKEINRKDQNQYFGLLIDLSYFLVTVEDPETTIAAATVQNFLDRYLEENSKTTIDYIHGIDVTNRLGRESGSVGIFLPPVEKSNFFQTVVHDGAFPRKTFSMGEAFEKRFYIEARKIAR